MLHLKAVEPDRCRVIPLQGSISVTVAPSTQAAAPSATDTAAAAEWTRLQSLNTQLFDGPILSVVSLDLATNTIATKRDRYARLAVQPTVFTGVRLLAVTAVIIRAGSLLLLQRSPSVHRYQGMWEVGPSGGLFVPPGPICNFDQQLIRTAALDEIEEEVGIALPPAAVGDPIAFLRDDDAFSDDLVLPVAWPTTPGTTPALNWENTRAKWVPLRDLDFFIRAQRNEIAPPTRALLTAIVASL